MPNKSGTKGMNTVNANHDKLPDEWWLDDYLREEVHTRIEWHLNDGLSTLESARRIGCSSRTVQRIRK